MDKININKATPTQLVKLIHIGKVRSISIIRNRPYKDVFELSKVLGLGTKRMQDILDQGLIIA